MGRRTDTTRVSQVRISSKTLAELIVFMSENEGWQIETIGGFLRDVVESFHFMASSKPQFQHFQDVAEAEEFIQQHFGTGKTNKRNLSLTQFQYEMRGSAEQHYQPSTRYEKKNQKRRKPNQPTVSKPPQSLQDSIPQEIYQKYEQLEQKEKSWIDGMIETGEFNWEQIENAVDMHLSKLNQYEDNNTTNEQPAETTNIDSDPENKTYEQLEQEQREKDQEQLDEMKQQLKQPPNQQQTDS